MKTRHYVYMAITVLVFAVTQQTSSGFTIPSSVVRIPAGTFLMGTTNGTGEVLDNAERPQTRVTISLGFLMSRYETTQAEFFAVMGTNPSYFKLGDSATRPVEYVSWQEALEYCVRLTEREQQEGRLPAGWVYRLPTEAEWEYACRAGTTTAFHYGTALRSGMAAFDGRYEYDTLTGPTNNTNGIRATKPVTVGSYAPNAWGLYDMHGNVEELCLDLRGQYPGGEVVDPLNTTAGTPFRVTRGGSWRNMATGCRSAWRGQYYTGRYNYIGFRVVLAPINTAWRQVLEKYPVKPTYTAGPIKQHGKDSLIVVTHGWNPGDAAWVVTMTNDLTWYLKQNGLSNWQVHAHLWIEKATILRRKGGPEKALALGKEEGSSLAGDLRYQDWKHIHLIGHSAGSALIQATTDKIKSLPLDTSIHTTFLDPFIGFRYDGESKYGKNANWSEQYFATDDDTYDDIISRTDSILENAYNVDVTLLDPNKEPMDVYSSGSFEPAKTCYVVKSSSHSWPYEFYMRTIPPSTVSSSEGFGFLLSKEGGNWDYATNQYRAGKDSLKILGDDIPPHCVPNTERQIYTPPPLDFSGLKKMESLDGTILIDGNSLLIATVAPIIPAGIRPASAEDTPYTWVAFEIMLSNRVNTLSFEANFADNASATSSLVTVYWDTNELGQIDGEITDPGVQKYHFAVPDTRSSQGPWVLGFRLDSFSGAVSSATITNITLGFAGVKEPFSLSLTGERFDDRAVLELRGPSGCNYTAESSTNLTDWSSFAVLVNTNGVVRFIDPAPPGNTIRFYRAVAP